ncbi:MAG: hypothetical protein FJ029_07140, partial [Actinobacteria bacterium]|nr:hypothetical protein [Actinomycetota bacterium]
SLAAGIYFDFTVAIALVAMNARVLFLLRSAGRRALAFVAAELVAAAVVVPWLVLATGLRESLPALGTGAVDGDGLRAALGSAWQDLFAGSAETRGGRAPLLVSAVLGALAVAGLAASVRIRRAGLLWAYLGAALAFLVLLLAFDKPYQARYVLPAVPAVAVFVGLAITWIPAGRMRTAAGLVAAAIVLAGPLYAARAYYTHYQRGDYRSITTTIESLARPRRPGRDEGKFRDAVVLAGPWQGWYWRHYFPNFLDKVDVWFLPEQVPPAVTAQEVEASLGRAQDSHRRLWVVLAGLEQADPNHLTERWLTTHAWQARSEVYRNGVLQLYLTNVLDLVDRQGRLDIAGDFALELLQYTGYRDDQGPREAGDGVRFTLFLRAQRPVAYDLRVRVWLRGPGGVVYAKDAFVQDDGLRRTSQWLPNEEHVLRTAIWIPAEATPGVYEAYVAFIAPDGSGLPVVGHLAGFRYPWVNALWIGPVRIDPPSVPLPNEAELRSRLGGPIR